MVRNKKKNIALRVWRETKCATQDLGRQAQAQAQVVGSEEGHPLQCIDAFVCYFFLSVNSVCWTDAVAIERLL